MSTSAKEYKAKLNKQSLKSAKYSSRVYNRCSNCGRSGAYFSHFGLCRICLRNFAFKGEVPGLTKASW